MIKVLVPVDGSEPSLRAVKALPSLFPDDIAEIHLLNVQIPVDSGHARMFVSQDQLRAYYTDEAEAELKEARHHLDRTGIRYHVHTIVGHVAHTIVNFARDHQFSQIVLGYRKRSTLANALLGSIATEVLEHSELPVTLVK